jgi:nitrile hydratase subunit beta
VEPPAPLVHDLGGRPGFGAVPVDDGVVFHADWERRAFGLANLAQVLAGFNVDAFRHAIERISPGDYFRWGYYGRWLQCAETMLREGGVLPVGEGVRTTDATPPEAPGARRPLPEDARYAPGDRVLVLAPVTTGHTRRPAYVQGHRGGVVADLGGWVLPDTHAHGRGEQPARVYTVAFAAGDLWPDAEPGVRVMVDLFEPYLEPA